MDRPTRLDEQTAQRILQEAFALKAAQDETPFTLDDVRSMGAELDLPPDLIEAAAQKVFTSPSLEAPPVLADGTTTEVPPMTASTFLLGLLALLVLVGLVVGVLWLTFHAAFWLFAQMPMPTPGGYSPPPGQYTTDITAFVNELGGLLSPMISISLMGFAISAMMRFLRNIL